MQPNRNESHPSSFLSFLTIDIILHTGIISTIQQSEEKPMFQNQIDILAEEIFIALNEQKKQHPGLLGCYLSISAGEELNPSLISVIRSAGYTVDILAVTEEEVQIMLTGKKD